MGTMGAQGDGFLPLIAASAAATAASLVALQTDFISRKIMDPKGLDAKRRSEYQYKWKTSLEKTHLQLEYCLAGGFKTFSMDEKINERNTEFLTTPEELDALVKRISSKDAKFCCLKIDKDSKVASNEYYVYVMDKNAPVPMYQLPLMEFGLKLAKAFEDQLTATTMCFVADASSGKGTRLLEQLVVEAKTNVAVCSEPLWLCQLARLVEANLFPSQKVHKLLFGLCRMEAWCLRDESKESRTVMITLPGQATTATLLPLVQACFPEDRHVFVYDGCSACVQRGMTSRRNYGRGIVQKDLNNVLHNLCQDPIIHTVPLPSLSPLTKSVDKLMDALSLLPLAQAQIVETWMGSVDAFFKLKEDDFNNGYLPYILKLKYLTSPSSKDFKPKSEAYWSLCSTLQYITGTRSRPMEQGVIDSAVEFMKDFNEQGRMETEKEPPILLSFAEKKVIEECVFKHKSILLGDKTLKDTVQPKQHWTLKEHSKKGGCACCGPDPFEEVDENQEAKAALMDKARGVVVKNPVGFVSHAPSPTSTTPTYVDAKLGFAFDPSRFS